MKIKCFLVFLLLLFTIFSAWSVERIIVKETKDQYTGNFVLINSEHIVFVLFNQRFEFTHDEVEYINFEDSDSELEILLDDNSVLKGMIVDQDDDFFTVGSSAGLTTIDKVRIVEIKNPKFEEFYEKEVEEKSNFINVGIIPSGTLILNDVGNSYQPYWSVELFAESNFFTQIYFGIDISILMPIGIYDNAEALLLFIPIHFYLRYQGTFGDPEKEGINKYLSWYVKLGAGCAPAFLIDTSEGAADPVFALSFSNVADIGLAFSISKSFALGIGTKFNLIVQSGSYISTQSVGLLLKFIL